MRFIYWCLLFCMTHPSIFAGNCIIPGSYYLEETGSGPYTYTFVVDLDTISGNDTKFLEITYHLSGGFSTTVCVDLAGQISPLIHSIPGQTESGQTGNLSYISWTSNVGCQGGNCDSGTVDNSLLPMTLIDFEVEEHEGAVIIEWTTANEINHDRYEIERSSNLVSFETVEVLNSTGAELGETRYEVVDREAPEGQIYYRLKSVDLDGSFEYSAVASVLKAGSQLDLFPNPTKGKVYLAMAALIELAGPVYLIDGTGQRIPLDMVITNGQVMFDLTRFKSGIYIIQTPLRSFRVVRL